VTDIFKGATDQTIFIELVDSTTGLPKTGILYTAVTGSYARTRSARVAITMATLASASAAHSDGGFILVDDTNQPGVYRVDVPDAAFASGAPEVVCTFKATGCRTVSRSINLVNINNQVAYAPNAAADAAGGLVVSDAGGLDIDSRLDAAVSSRLAPTTAGRTLDVSTGGEAGIDWANVGSPTTTVAFTGTTIATTQKVDVETIKTNPCVNAGTVTFPQDGTIASRTNITAATGIVLSGVTHTGAVIPTVTTLTGHTAQTGDTYAIANGAAGFVAIDTVVDAILADTGTDGVVVASGSKTGYTLTATTGLGNQTADITGTVSGNSTHNAAAVLSALGTGSWATSLATQASVDDLPTNAELATALGTADDAVLAAIAALQDLSSSEAFTAVLTTQLTESYAADGAAPTLAQAIFLIQQALTEFAISGTTTTIKKVDGSTTAATLTLDDGTTPTSVTRAT